MRSIILYQIIGACTLIAVVIALMLQFALLPKISGRTSEIKKKLDCFNGRLFYLGSNGHWILRQTSRCTHTDGDEVRVRSLRIKSKIF